MWMCLEEGEEVVGGRREVFWAVVGVGLCDRRKGWRWMAGEEMMTFSFSVCYLLYWKDGTGCLAGERDLIVWKTLDYQAPTHPSTH